MVSNEWTSLNVNKWIYYIMNSSLLQERYRQLVPPHKVVKPLPLSLEDDLAVLCSLALTETPITPENALVRRMEANLPYLSDDLKPFGEAILELYKRSTTQVDR
jgi:hypothetical protein